MAHRLTLSRRRGRVTSPVRIDGTVGARGRRRTVGSPKPRRCPRRESRPCASGPKHRHRPRARARRCLSHATPCHEASQCRRPRWTRSPSHPLFPPCLPRRARCRSSSRRHGIPSCRLGHRPWWTSSARTSPASRRGCCRRGVMSRPGPQLLLPMPPSDPCPARTRAGKIHSSTPTCPGTSAARGRVVRASGVASRRPIRSRTCRWTPTRIAWSTIAEPIASTSSATSASCVRTRR